MVLVDPGAVPGSYTNLHSGFGQPGHSDEDFLLQVESSKVDQQEGDKQTDHQPDADASQT